MIVSKNLSRWSVAGAAAAILALIGCGGQAGPAHFPVSGKVTLNGAPAKEGSVTFSDASGMTKLVGGIGPDGGYSLMHNREPGAPLGEYVVTVYVTETAIGPDGNPQGLPKTISHAKFRDPGTTPLRLQVKEETPPGAYDIAVTN
ncbi:hypothetical protein [Lacipirellula parvula]|uniref:Carboxypeptidase regulatory-like domain-containing protein n=1 Tax=Lacipirellula parvula TaxID=2650471 RepID=A0A5K7XFM3_9BACT|nr:hypothetical protein [Lacipirellula parvula]BBO35195.1 hypothetical protein PLANPX_4807 [Lacipirellula parvula]